jgi:glucoamylase
VLRITLAVATVVLAASTVSGATEQPPEPIQTKLPSPDFGTVSSGPFSRAGVRERLRPLETGAPPWARRLYRRSVRVLVALTDPRSGAMIAGERDGWDYVWPRDAAAGAIAFEAAGLRPEARRMFSFLDDIDTERAARFYPDGSPVPGRPAAGDAAGWVEAVQRAIRSGIPDRTVLPSGRVATTAQDSPFHWRDRQDYGENVTGDLLGNAVAGGASATEIEEGFLTPRGLTREEGADDLDSAAAWAATLFPQPVLRSAIRRTLLALVRESNSYGIPPIEGWTPGEVLTAPTAWSAWALVELGERRAADRLLGALRRAETPYGTLPERVAAATGAPTSTTPLAWSHAFAILALRARYG